MTAFDLLVVGDANPDVVLHGVPRSLPYGQREQLVDRGELVLGGSAAIMACGAARLGLRTAFAGRVGDDAAGRFVLDQLTGRGVDVSACVVDRHRPTALTVVLAAGEDRSILTSPGCLPHTEVPSTMSTMDARAVHVSSYFLQPRLAAALPAWFAALRSAGVQTSLDTNDDPSGRWDPAVHQAIAQSDVVLPNEAEARALTGSTDLTEACRRLGGRDRLVVVKRGGDGAAAWYAGELMTVPGLAVKPVDTVGAGDSFDAGFLAAVLNGLSVPEALRLAVVCGSLSTLAAGGTAAQPTMAEAVAAR